MESNLIQMIGLISLKDNKLKILIC